MIWHILRYWIAFIIPGFYKKIQAKNLHRVFVKQPVIIAMNHPNAFTDPVAFTTLTHPVKLKYLARGDAFKPGFVTWFLESIGIVPIFRIQDGGKEGLKKNDDSYRRVNYLLSRNSKIIVFAEGLCVQERRLRPLKKGVARMVFGAYESLGTDNLLVLPVGVNYSEACKFRSTIFYNVGEPIRVKDFMEEYRKNPARANNLFLQELEPRMRELVTHIQDPANDKVVLQAEILLKRKILVVKNLNPNDLADDFTALKEITALVNNANKETLSEFKIAADKYFAGLKKNGLRDWLFDPARKVRISFISIFLRSVILLLTVPLFLTGVLGNVLPIILAHKTTLKLTKLKEFYSSFAIGFAMVFFLFQYIVWYYLAKWLMPVSVWPPFILLLLALCAWFSTWYLPFFKKTLGMFRVFTQSRLNQAFSEERRHLMLILNKF